MTMQLDLTVKEAIAVEHALDMLNVVIQSTSFPMSAESKLVVLRSLLTPATLSALGKFQHCLGEIREDQVREMGAIAQQEVE